MFNLFFIRSHRSKVITYIDTVLESRKKSPLIGEESSRPKVEPGPKYSLELDFESLKHKSDDSGSGTTSYTSKPRVKYCERESDTDSFDAQSVANAMRSHLQEKQPAAPLMSSAKISFVKKLEQYMRERHLVASEVYKAANIDRRLFSKILCNQDYQPSKDTVLALVFSLKLNLNEAKDLLERAGYTLSHSIKRDIILEYFIKEGIYNLNNINAFLYNMDEKIIGRSV